LGARLFPTGLLQPGEAGAIEISLNTSAKTFVGDVLEYVLVSAAAQDGDGESYRFAVEAFFDGLTSVSSPYVVRGEARAGRAEPLELVLLSSERDPQFELRDVTSRIVALRPLVASMASEASLSRGRYYRSV
jgi:hypothetical protein